MNVVAVAKRVLSLTVSGLGTAFGLYVWREFLPTVSSYPFMGGLTLALIPGPLSILPASLVWFGQRMVAIYWLLGGAVASVMGIVWLRFRGDIPTPSAAAEFFMMFTLPQISLGVGLVFAEHLRRKQAWQVAAPSMGEQ